VRPDKLRQAAFSKEKFSSSSLPTLSPKRGPRGPPLPGLEGIESPPSVDSGSSPLKSPSSPLPPTSALLPPPTNPRGRQQPPSTPPAGTVRPEPGTPPASSTRASPSRPQAKFSGARPSLTPRPTSPNSPKVVAVSAPTPKRSLPTRSAAHVRQAPSAEHRSSLL
jgi:hypothetical protein